MGEIGREVSETLDYKPASLFVRRTIRPKYACQKCHEGVLTAEPPRGPIERGLPGPGLLAQVVVGKYADHTHSIARSRSSPVMAWRSRDRPCRIGLRLSRTSTRRSETH
jgi:transposase